MHAAVRSPCNPNGGWKRLLSKRHHFPAGSRSSLWWQRLQKWLVTKTKKITLSADIPPILPAAVTALNINEPSSRVLLCFIQNLHLPHASLQTTKQHKIPASKYQELVWNPSQVSRIPNGYLNIGTVSTRSLCSHCLKPVNIGTCWRTDGHCSMQMSRLPLELQDPCLVGTS